MKRKSKFLLIIFFVTQFCYGQNIDVTEQKDTISDKIQKIAMFCNCLSSEYADTDDIFIVGIKEIDSLIVANIGKLWVTIPERNLASVTNIRNVKKGQYYIFNKTSYKMVNRPSFIWSFLLRNNVVSSDLKAILLKAYPHPLMIASGVHLYGEDGKEHVYKGIKYKKLQSRQFLVILVKVAFYNKYQSHSRPPDYLFLHHPAEQGMYIKVLIPLLEEDEKKE